MMCGDYREALPHIEKAASLYRPEEHREFATGYSQDIGVSAFVHLSWALWHRGFPDQSATACDRAGSRPACSVRVRSWPNTSSALAAG
jgi:hypothetical protein